MWDSMLKNFFLAYVEVLLALGTLGYVMYLFKQYERNNFAPNEMKLPYYFKLQVLIPVCLVLAFLFHPGTKGAYYLTMQQLVALSIYSESIGLIPQLFMIRKERDTGNLSQYYVVFLAIARLLRLTFWIKMIIMGNKFYSLLIADVLHTIFLSDFVYNVIRNWNKVVLPTNIGGGSADPSKKIF